MSNPDTRDRVSKRLREMGHRPPTRGGNGTGLTRPQSLLLDALGDEWVPEYVIPCGEGRKKGGLPTHYKLDLANLRLLIDVEVDGASHALISRREADQRKDSWLESRGWLVLRFSNKEILSSISSVIEQITSIR